MLNANISPTVQDHRISSARANPTKLRLSGKHYLFCGLGLLTLVVLYHNERFLLNPRSGTWQFFNPVRGKLLLHALGGAVALFLGPLQFSDRFRRHHPAIHRVLGRCYLAGVMVAAPIAIYLGFFHALPALRIVTAVQASVWMLTTILAIVAARRLRFELHREWVMRSYSVTLIFVISRIILDMPLLGPTTDAGAERLAWILNVCALLVPQLIINRRQLFSNSNVAPRKMARSTDTFAPVEAQSPRRSL